MAANLEMEALRLQNDALKAENARLKATRAAIYKLYLESEGLKIPACFSHKVFEALQLSADADRDKKEPAPTRGAATSRISCAMSSRMSISSPISLSLSLSSRRVWVVEDL